MLNFVKIPDFEKSYFYSLRKKNPLILWSENCFTLLQTVYLEHLLDFKYRLPSTLNREIKPYHFAIETPCSLLRTLRLRIRIKHNTQCFQLSRSILLIHYGKVVIFSCVLIIVIIKKRKKKSRKAFCLKIPHICPPKFQISPNQSPLHLCPQIFPHNVQKSPKWGEIPNSGNTAQNDKEKDRNIL